MYFLIFLSIISFIYILRLIYIKKKLDKKEQSIINLFNARVNLIPAIFEISQNTFTKHDQIFENLLKYRKQELYRYYIKENIDNVETEFLKLIHLEQLIHHELNFIFKIANKHKKLIKKGNFIYLRNILINKSLEIGNNIKDYKIKIELYNKLVIFNFFKKNTI